MPKKNSAEEIETPAIEAVEAEKPAARRDPLASEAGRAWLAAELARAEHAEEHGPDGAGWTFNEGLRAEIGERAAFLRSLTALLPQ